MIVVQHMPGKFTAALSQRLDAMSAVDVKEAADGDRPRPGLVLVAPGDRHLVIEDGGVIRLSNDAPVNGCRPAADVTMTCAARVFGHRAAGLVMTGMGRDGAAGLAAIKQADGVTFAQDRASCVIYGMPKAAIDAGVVDEVLALDAIAPRLAELT
jgi:two-component system chemotaxis response regulator CheB